MGDVHQFNSTDSIPIQQTGPRPARASSNACAAIPRAARSSPRLAARSRPARGLQQTPFQFNKLGSRPARASSNACAAIPRAARSRPAARGTLPRVAFNRPHSNSTSLAPTSVGLVRCLCSRPASPVQQYYMLRAVKTTHGPSHPL